jgi:hypothetical protein
VALVVLIDNTLSFSYYYNTGNKIEQVLSINQVLADSSLKNNDKQNLITLREQIINRKTWIEKFWGIIPNINFKKSNLINNADNLKEDKVEARDRYYIWHFISSSWVVLIVIIVIPFVGIFDKKTPLLHAIGTLIILEPLLFGIAWLFAKVFSYIPVLFNNYIYNYLLNAILCLVVFLVIGWLNRNNVKNKY